MPQSFCQIYVHGIFSTKNHQCWLSDAMRSRVHAYLATLARDCGCPYAHVGGAADHIHILADIGKKVAPVSMIAKVKQESSKFVKTLGSDYRDFYWQNGFGAFSVSPARIREVEAYITRQEEHHRKQTFQDELRAFLEKYGIEYDERYLWD